MTLMGLMLGWGCGADDGGQAMCCLQRRSGQVWMDLVQVCAGDGTIFFWASFNRRCRDQVSMSGWSSGLEIKESRDKSDPEATGTG